MQDSQDKETSTDEVQSTREYKKSGWGRDFPHPSTLFQGPIQPRMLGVCFPRVKRSGRGVNHPLPCSAEVKERVELYQYPPSVPSWPLPGRTLLYHPACCEVDTGCPFQGIKRPERGALPLSLILLIPVGV